MPRPRFLRPDGTLPPLAGHDPVLDRAPEGLREKLAQVEQSLTDLRSSRAAAVRDADAAKARFGATPGYDTGSDAYKAAAKAVSRVRDLDTKITEAQSAQVGILKMVGG